MKKKALALALVLCMVIAMLPVSVFAAPDQTVISGHDLPFVQQPIGLQTELKQLGTAEPNAKKYTLTLRENGYGDTAATAFSAAKGEIIYIQADPSEGYLAYFDTHGDDLDLVYIGYNMYELTMPGHNVTIDVHYKAAPGNFLAINMICKKYATSNIRRSQYGAKADENVFLYIKPDRFELLDITVTCGGQEVELYYLGVLEGEEIFEFTMPDGDVEVTIDTLDTRPSGMYLTLNEREYLPKAGENTYPEGKIYFSVDKAKALEQVTVQILPNEGYRLADLEITGTSAWDYTKFSLPYTNLGNNHYAFIMPESVIHVYVTLVQMIHPVSVTVETGLGGSAITNVTEAKLGDTVTLTCTPDEGYRIARITGVKNLVDNGDGTYTFTMPDEAVELKVLFLRHENPFLDVNETQFFYTPVLWAVEENITAGLAADSFGPFAVCNRAQVVTFLWRAAGCPEPSGTENPFTDVAAGSFYEKAVLWAVENGITAGISATEFGPGLACNRAQVVTFLYRARNAQLPEGVVNPFEDVDEKDFYYAPVLWALENGVTAGSDATHFNPNGQCQRAQVVTFLYRAKDLPIAYDLNCAVEGEGTITLSHTAALAGETVTVTVTPAEGWVLDRVWCENGTELTQISDTEYTFVMPGQEEIVHASFLFPEEPPVDPEIPVEPDPTDPTDPVDPEPTDPVDPEPTDPTDPEIPVDSGF